MTNDVRLTEAEHASLGFLLSAVSTELTRVSVRVGQSSGKTSAASRAMTKTLDALAGVRSSLENEMRKQGYVGAEGTYYPVPSPVVPRFELDVSTQADELIRESVAAPVALFADERCTVHPAVCGQTFPGTGRRELFREYTRWAVAGGHANIGERAFLRSFTELPGVTNVMTAGRAVALNVTVRDVAA